MTLLYWGMSMSLFFRKQTYRNYTLEELILSAQSNDIQAIEELIKREQKNVYATLYYLNNDKSEILDNTQEILFRMCKNLDKLKSPRAFRSWLNRIIVNYYYDTIRKKNKIPQTVPVEKITADNEVLPSYETLLADNRKPDETFLLKELDNVITSSVQELPEQLKIAIVLREFQGLSYDEIANVTGTNVGTVKSRIARARMKLQEKLRNYMR